MKIALLILMIITISPPVNSRQSDQIINHSELSPYSLRVIASVTEGNFDQVILLVEEVIDYGSGIKTTPVGGESITVRLPGRDKPGTNSRIEVELLEKVEVGATPSSYIMTGFKTIE